METNAVAESETEEVVENEEAEVVELEAGEIVRIPLAARVSALLFVASKPMTVEALAAAANVKNSTIERALPKIAALYDDQLHGFSLHEVAGGWQFRTSPGASASIQRLIPRGARKLSRAAAESLAVIAYKQPVQRAEIEAIRGVDALPTLKTLLDARLIRIVGRENSAGKPALYGTTTTFLEKFGLVDLSELPSPREIAELMEDPGEPDSDTESEIPSEPSIKVVEGSAKAENAAESDVEPPIADVEKE